LLRLKKKEKIIKKKIKDFQNFDEKYMKNEEKLYNCYLKIRKVLHDNDGEFIKEDNEFY